ncbi:MAG: TIM barrel protein [Planctomycetota bacterium]
MVQLQRKRLTRRSAIAAGSSAWLLSSSAALRRTQASELSEANGCTLGFSTYGMPSIKSERAIGLLNEIGFDNVEISIRAGADADSAALSSSRRREICNRLSDSGMKLTSLMEHVGPPDNKEQQEHALQRLRQAAELAYELSPDSPPLVQSVLGGGGDFSSERKHLRDYLGRWSELAQELNIVFALKPHRGGVVSRPSEAIWLFEQLGKPERLRKVLKRRLHDVASMRTRC